MERSSKSKTNKRNFIRNTTWKNYELRQNDGDQMVLPRPHSPMRQNNADKAKKAAGQKHRGKSPMLNGKWTKIPTFLTVKFHGKLLIFGCKKRCDIFASRYTKSADTQAEPNKALYFKTLATLSFAFRRPARSYPHNSALQVTVTTVQCQFVPTERGNTSSTIHIECLYANSSRQVPFNGKSPSPSPQREKQIIWTQHWWILR